VSYRSKISKFFYPQVYLTTQVWMTPLEYHQYLWRYQTRLPGTIQRLVAPWYVCCFNRTTACVRQTDGQHIQC